MSVQMLSGPDLGGGYLHQLSFEPEDGASTFTYHAQDGGSDAGGPPAGPLDVFGYVHPPSPCMFGGPRCWHRRFRLDLGEAPRVRAAYNRSRFVLETMIAQAYLGTAVPVESGTAEVVDRLAAVLDREGIAWHIGGSVAARVLGADLAPRDLDLGTTRAGVDRIAEQLREFLIEPVGPTDWPGRGIVQGARAFVGTFREGIRVEWAVPLEPLPLAGLDEWDASPSGARTESVPFRGHVVRVTRPEYALVRAAERGRAAAVEAVRTLLRTRGADDELLVTLLDRSRLPAPERARLRAAVSNGDTGATPRAHPNVPS